MKKEKLYDLGLVAIVTFLSCWLFWAAIGKKHIEKFIKENYGTAIIETNNNSKLSLKLLENDS